MKRIENYSISSVVRKLQTPTNNYTQKPLESFLKKISFKYSVPYRDIYQEALVSIFKALIKRDNRNFDAYVWHIIRNDMISYIRQYYRKSQTIVRDAANVDEIDEHTIIEELDELYDHHWDRKWLNHFEMERDFQQIFKGVKGHASKILSMIDKYGNRPNFICRQLKIDRRRYDLNLRLLQTHFIDCGYSY